MVFFVGNDDFESLIQARKYAKNIQCKNNAYSIETIDATNIENVHKFFSDMTENNFFQDKAIYIVKYFLENKQLVDYLVENWSKVKELSNLILFEKGNLDKRSNLYKLSSSDKILNIYEPLKNKELNKWVKEISKSLDLDLNEEHINILIKRWNNNKWGIFTELKKFKLISPQKWNSILTDTYTPMEENLWNMTDLFLKKNFNLYVAEYISYIQQKKEVIDQLIISIINKNMRNIALIKYCKMQNKDIKQLPIHPYVLEKLLRIENLWSIEEIQKLIYKLIKIDNDIKSGVGHFNSQFLSLIYELI